MRYRAIMLVLEEINGRAQFATKGRHKGFEVRLDFSRHSHFDALCFCVADAHQLGQSVCQSVAADVDYAAQGELAFLQKADRRILEANINQCHHLLGKSFRHGHLERVHRSDQCRNNVVGKQPRVLNRSLQVVQILLSRAGCQYFALQNIPSPFRSVRHFGGLPGWDDVTVKDVAWEILLEVSFGVVSQNLPHVIQRHERYFRVANYGVIHADRQRHWLMPDFERLGYSSEVLGQQIHGDVSFVNRRIHQRVTGKDKAFPFAKEVDGFGGTFETRDPNWSIEAGAQAGGRCRSYFDPQIGLTIDNGNHLVLSGNRAVAEYLARLGAQDRLAGPAEAAFPFVDLASGARWATRSCASSASARDRGGKLLVERLRMVFVRGTVPEVAVRSLKPGGQLHVCGIPRLDFAEISRRVMGSRTNPSLLTQKLPYEIIILGVFKGAKQNEVQGAAAAAAVGVAPGPPS